MPDTESTTQITNGELFRAVELIRGDIGGLRSDLGGRPTANDLTYLKERISDLENWQTWATRLGIPSLIGTATVAFANLAQRLQ